MIFNMVGGGGGKVFAVIDATYSKGATITCAKGNKLLVAKDTTGHWLFLIPEAGEWVVTITQAERDPVSQTVNITSSAAYQVELFFTLYIFKSGTGLITDCVYGNNSKASLTLNNTSITTNFLANTGGVECSLRSSGKIDLTEFKTIYIDLTVKRQLSDASGQTAWNLGFGVSSKDYTQTNDSETAKVFDIARKIPTKASRKTISIDVTSVNGEYYVGFWGAGEATVYNFWIE